MKPILALVTLALAIVVLEEEVREVAGEAQTAYGEVIEQARGAAGNFSERIGRQPIMTLLIAAGVEYVTAWLTTARNPRPRSR
jgi:hypothetical protein